MPLKMKSRCQQCRQALLPSGEAYICSYECTFCPVCAEALNRKCPNCDEELLLRPKRTTPLMIVAARGAVKWWSRLRMALLGKNL